MGGDMILRNAPAHAIHRTQSKLRVDVTLFGKGLPRSKRGCKITTHESHQALVKIRSPTGK